MARNAGARLSLELPDATRADGLVPLLNERLRRLQGEIERLSGASGPVVLEGELDLGGHRVRNLGDAREGADALNLREAERRYAGGSTGGETRPPTTPGGAAPAAGGVAGRTLVLTVPGTLAIQSSAAPLVSVGQEVAAEALVALVKQAPAGGALTVRLLQAGQAWATLTIAAGQTTAHLAGAGLGPLRKDALVTLDLTGVGATFPGADLTVMVRLA